MNTVVSSRHLEVLLSAFAKGHTSNAEVFGRVLERLSEPSTAQLELLKSLQMLKETREAIRLTLDTCEQGGFSALAVLCRNIMRSALCAFLPVQRWGVCAVTGQTVNRLLLITIDDIDEQIDYKFAVFVRSLWNVSHFEVIEALRAECSECSEGSEGSEDSAFSAESLLKSYAAAFAQVKSTLRQTLAKLCDLSRGAESQNLPG